jgi:hypothetical protein
VHADNARLHTARLSVELLEDNQMKTAPHPPHSPDIASFNFYLSVYVIGYPTDRSFMDAEDRFDVVRAVLDSSEKGTLQAVSLEWMDRLRKAIQANGNYTEQAQERFL